MFTLIRLPSCVESIREVQAERIKEAVGESTTQPASMPATQGAAAARPSWYHNLAGLGGKRWAGIGALAGGALGALNPGKDDEGESRGALSGALRGAMTGGLVGGLGGLAAKRFAGPNGALRTQAGATTAGNEAVATRDLAANTASKDLATAEARRSKMVYNPGTAGAIRQTNPGTGYVQSIFRKFVGSPQSNELARMQAGHQNQQAFDAEIQRQRRATPEHQAWAGHVGLVNNQLGLTGASALNPEHHTPESLLNVLNQHAHADPAMQGTVNSLKARMNAWQPPAAGAQQQQTTAPSALHTNQNALMQAHGLDPNIIRDPSQPQGHADAVMNHLGNLMRNNRGQATQLHPGQIDLLHAGNRAGFGRFPAQQTPPNPNQAPPGPNPNPTPPGPNPVPPKAPPYSYDPKHHQPVHLGGSPIGTRFDSSSLSSLGHRQMLADPHYAFNSTTREFEKMAARVVVDPIGIFSPTLKLAAPRRPFTVPKGKTVAERVNGAFAPRKTKADIAPVPADAADPPKAETPAKPAEVPAKPAEAPTNDKKTAAPATPSATALPGPGPASAVAPLKIAETPVAAPAVEPSSEPVIKTVKLAALVA